MRKLTAVDGYYSRFPEGFVFDWDGGDDDNANALASEVVIRGEQRQGLGQEQGVCWGDAGGVTMRDDDGSHGSCESSAYTADDAHVNGRSSSSSSLPPSSTAVPSLPHTASSSTTAAAAFQDSAEAAATTTTTTAVTAFSGLAECAVKLFAMGGSHEHFLQAVIQGLRLRSFLLHASINNDNSAYATPPDMHHPMAACGGQLPLLLLYTDDDKDFTQWSGDRLAVLVEQLRNVTETAAVTANATATARDSNGANDGAVVIGSDPITIPSSVLAIFDRVVPLSALQPLLPPASHYPTDTAIREYLYMHRMDSFHHAPSLWLHRALSFIHAGQHHAKAVLQLDADVMPCGRRDEEEEVANRVFSSLGPNHYDLVTVIDPNELYGGTNREPRYPYPAQHFHADWTEYPERLLHFLLVNTNIPPPIELSSICFNTLSDAPVYTLPNSQRTYSLTEPNHNPPPLTIFR